MKRTIVLTMLIVFVLASPGIAATINPEAVKNLTGNPALYATVKTVVEDGQEKEVVVFNKLGIHFCPKCLDQIFAVYGLSINDTAVKEGQVPESFAVVREFEEDGVTKEEVVFGRSGILYSPDRMHAILTAYGLSLTPEDVEKLPSSYATVKMTIEDGQEVESIVFSKAGISYNPVSLNQILEAYHE